MTMKMNIKIRDEKKTHLMAYYWNDRIYDLCFALSSAVVVLNFPLAITVFCKKMMESRINNRKFFSVDIYIV